jgi:enoyl-CoA hydratase/carnithine racemase
VAGGADRVRVLDPVVRETPLWGAVQLDRMHTTFLRMNGSGVIFVAALNGSALGLGAEFAWACDLRVMADGDFFIGHPEVLLGINPGGGGTQRLTRLIGTHKSLLAILEGKPLTPAEALANGAVDEARHGEALPGPLKSHAGLSAFGNYIAVLEVDHDRLDRVPTTCCREIVLCGGASIRITPPVPATARS